MQEHVRKTLELVVAQIQELDAQLTDKRRTANDLCRLLDQPPMYGDLDSGSAATSTRPDEYYGRPMPEVIRVILGKRKRANQGAATVNELYDAMKAGGFDFQAAKPEYDKRGIYGVLGSDESFHKLPGGEYGLAEWYPAAKARREEKATKPKPRSKSAKPQAKQRTTAPAKGSSSVPPTKANPEAETGTKGPTDAVWQYVREHPGQERLTVVEKVVALPFATESTDRRELVRSIIRQMLNKNRLRADGEKLYVVERIAG